MESPIILPNMSFLLSDPSLVPHHGNDHQYQGYQGQQEINEGGRFIEVDDDVDMSDHDSTYSSLGSTGSSSLTDSVRNFLHEHGRRFHAESIGDKYVFPNDKIELDRLDYLNEILHMVVGDKLFLAPIDPSKVHRVLDVGTGTGVWAIEFAMRYPHVEVLGNDISPVQNDFVPINVKFEVDDVETGWMHSNSFDFIFLRYLTLAISDWPQLVKNIYDNLSPGGWVEFQDYDSWIYSDDGSIQEGDAVSMWEHVVFDAARRINKEPAPGPSLEKWVRDQGFINIQHRVFKIPSNSWPKDPKLKMIGAYMLDNLFQGLEGFNMRLLCGALGWTEQEVTVLLAGVKRQLYSTECHGYWNWHVVTAQKPEDAPDPWAEILRD